MSTKIGTLLETVLVFLSMGTPVAIISVAIPTGVVVTRVTVGESVKINTKKLDRGIEMTFFLLKDKNGNAHLVRWEKGAMPWMQECLKRYKTWLEEAKTRKQFVNSTESGAAGGGVNGFICFLSLIGEPVQTYWCEDFEELDLETGQRKSIA
jgi:hypothetical protein